MRRGVVLGFGRKMGGVERKENGWMIEVGRKSGLYELKTGVEFIQENNVYWIVGEAKERGGGGGGGVEDRVELIK